MTNQTAVTVTTNIVPVQAIFDVNGVCVGLVGPGGEFFSPPLSSDVINQATITNSTINSSTIGATTPSTGTFTTMTTNNAQITGGSITGVSITITALNGTPVGNITPSTGAFTTLSATTTTTTNLAVTGITGLLYANATSNVTAATANQIVGVIGNTFVTNATNATNATNTTNIIGGSSGAVAYQSATGVTAFATGTGVLVGGTTPTFTTTPTITGTNISGTATSLSIGGNAATATSSTNLSGGSTYAFPYQTSSGTTTFLSAGTSGQILQTLGTGAIPAWVSQSTLSVGSATNIVGGSAGVMPYQTAIGATGFTAVGSASQLLQSNGTSAPSWVSASTLTVSSATNLSGGGAGYIPYQSASGSTLFLSAGTTGYVLQSNGTSAPSWVLPTAYATITDDTTSTGTRYPLFSSATSGNIASEYTSSTKLQYQPSTGTLTSTIFVGAWQGTVVATTYGGTGTSHGVNGGTF